MISIIEVNDILGRAIILKESWFVNNYIVLYYVPSTTFFTVLERKDVIYQGRDTMKAIEAYNQLALNNKTKSEKA